MIIPKSELTFITVLACPLTCQNNEKLNAGTCTCDCADGYSGDTCRSQCTMQLNGF